MTACEAFANILADLGDENSTAPTFMRCVRKRLIGESGSIKPRELFGIPQDQPLKGTRDEVLAVLATRWFYE